MAKIKQVPELAQMAQKGDSFSVRATPNAAQNSVTLVGDVVQVRVTATPEGGKANTAVIKALAAAMGIAKSRLRLKSGASSRDKEFLID